MGGDLIDSEAPANKEPQQSAASRDNILSETEQRGHSQLQTEAAQLQADARKNKSIKKTSQKKGVRSNNNGSSSSSDSSDEEEIYVPPSEEIAFSSPSPAS